VAFLLAFRPEVGVGVVAGEPIGVVSATGIVEGV